MAATTDGPEAARSAAPPTPRDRVHLGRPAGSLRQVSAPSAPRVNTRPSLTARATHPSPPPPGDGCGATGAAAASADDAPSPAAAGPSGCNSRACRAVARARPRSLVVKSASTATPRCRSRRRASGRPKSTSTPRARHPGASRCQRGEAGVRRGAAVQEVVDEDDPVARPDRAAPPPAPPATVRLGLLADDRARELDAVVQRREEHAGDQRVRDSVIARDRCRP